jgi:hypothetical protein
LKDFTAVYSQLWKAMDNWFSKVNVPYNPVFAELNEFK